MNKLFKYGLLYKRFTTVNRTPFSLKNKINLFFKHVHPDVLGGTCPSEYRLINEKSLQEFNSYLECLEKVNSNYENKIIDFYVKVEEKDKKDEKINISFSKLSVNLETIERKLSETNKLSLQMNLSNYLDSILIQIQKFKKQGNTNNFKLRDNEQIIEEDELLIKPNILKSEKLMNDFQKVADYHVMKNFQSQSNDYKLKNKFMEQIDRTLHSRTKFLKNRRKVDPVSKQLAFSLDALKSIKDFNDNIFPPSLVFFDESIKNNQIEEFIKRIKIQKDISLHAKHKSFVKQLCQDGVIRLYVNKSFNIDMPGFISIPYDFEFDKLLEFFNNNKDEIYRRRKKFIEENKAISAVTQELKIKFSIKDINITYKSKNHLQRVQDMHLTLKRLKKLLNEKFRECKINLEVNLYKLKNELIESKSGEYKLNISYPFKEEQIEKVLKNKILN